MTLFTYDPATSVSMDLPAGTSAQPRKKVSVDEIKSRILQTLDDKKGEQITEISLNGKADFADYMILATGTSQRHVASLAGYIVDTFRAAQIEPLSIEGLDSADWVLVDGGDIVVHLFRPDARAHYNLEKMWSVSLPAK
jgi:ribosome-associated protein